ncbi:hypothetical protein FQN57_003511 [Myotisia sp. PD_48]|nr:hypothetical protein FQN57_003511 [Myotisia sp. PD_48]
MAFSRSPLPGDFFLDSPVPPKLDLAGARSRIYRSPQTPSATSSLCRSVTSPSQSSRKRARYGYGLDSPHISGGLHNIVSWENQPPLSAVTSPAPLANTDYRLAGGGLDTVSAASITGMDSQMYGDETNGPELDYRPNRYGEPNAPGTSLQADYKLAAPFLGRPGTSRGEKRKREDNAGQLHSPGSSSWGKSVLNLVGGVAGKVWDFCWSAPFRGFYAGGGQAYNANNSVSTLGPSDPILSDKSPNDFFPSLNMQHREGTPVPGQYPDDERSHFNRSSNRDDLHQNWVLVKEDTIDSRESSPLHGVRKIPRRNSVMHYVPSRKPAARIHHSKRPSSTSTPTRPSTAPQQNLHSPHSIYRTPPKSSSVVTSNESPLALETQRHAAKLRRKEREEDASIRRLNQQLKAMIKEGKEALGTKIEVDEMDLGEWD